MQARWRAEYRCRACGHEFVAPAGPVACPMCRHEYIDWTNYQALADGRDTRVVIIGGQ